MASAKFEGGKFKTPQEVKAQFRHSEKVERLKHEHSNKDIDTSKTVNNYSMKNLSYEEMCKRYDERIRELDSTTNTNIRKDRVTCQGIEIKLPKDLPEEKNEEWFRKTWNILTDFYGEENAIEGIVHLDEIHDYLDENGEWQTSRGEIHTYFVPEVDGSQNGKKFSCRRNINELNKRIHEMTMRDFGVEFMDGTKRKSKATTEELKNASTVREALLDAEIEAKAELDIERYLSQLEYDKQSETMYGEIAATAFEQEQKSKELAQKGNRLAQYETGISKRIKAVRAREVAVENTVKLMGGLYINMQNRLKGLDLIAPDRDYTRQEFMKAHGETLKDGSVMTYEEMYQQYIRERNRNVVQAINVSKDYKQFRQSSELEKVLQKGNDMLSQKQKADELQYD